MTTYQKFKKLNIRHSAIGLEQSDTDVTYYCTPRDAAIIGWAGVDGIHYCTIPEFGEMIFAVSPMNFGDCVHPIAHSFEDLLRLLLSCGSMDALEQCYAWDEEQFKAFLIDCPATEEQQSVLDGLDVSLAWYMQRSSYRWGEVNGLDIQSLTVRMERQRENIAGQHFQTPTVGESISLTHPMTGKIYTLTVHEVEQQELPERAFHDPNMEYPSHYLAMSYSLEPDISGRGFMIQDCTEGDRPRQKKRDPDEFAPVAFCNAAVIGVIGGADGPTSVIMGQSAPKLHAACSSLLFEPIVDDVEWRVVFSEKLMDDVDVDLI